MPKRAGSSNFNMPRFEDKIDFEIWLSDVDDSLDRFILQLPDSDRGRLDFSIPWTILSPGYFPLQGQSRDDRPQRIVPI
jgi:hypothetical protein